MGAGNVRKIFQNITHGKIQSYQRTGVATLNHIFQRFILADELFLHGTPHNLSSIVQDVR